MRNWDHEVRVDQNSPKMKPFLEIRRELAIARGEMLRLRHSEWPAAAKPAKTPPSPPPPPAKPKPE